jgi:CheY-like chemotaxis protein
MADTLDKVEGEVELLRQHVAQAAATPRRALLVEDDRNECELLAGFLRMAGIEVAAVSDGADALDHLQARGRPDVVLLDMMLPRCDGPATVRAIRQNPTWQGLKIFAVTGANRERFARDLAPHDIDGWFPKPLNPEVLLRELNDNFSQPA